MSFVSPRVALGGSVPTMNFTVKLLASLNKPVAGRIIHWDQTCRGFGLRISHSGQRSWIAMYRVNGRQRFFTIGNFDRLPLADARVLAKDVLYRAAKGQDPAADKTRSRTSATFGDLAADYLERHAKVNKKSWAADERMLKADVLPHWGTLKACEIRRRDVIALLDRHVARGAPIVANRVLALVRKIFNFGLQRDLVETNPCQAISRPVDEKSRQGQRVLTFDEIRTVWPVIERESNLISAIFKLRLLSAQRGSEIRSMEWSEIDLETRWWTIPASKTKNKLQHRVPITDQIEDVFAEISWTKEASRFLFPSPVDRNAHIDNIQKAFSRIKMKSGIDFTDRDFRRTAASLMTGELGIPRMVVSKILNHVESGITKVYDRHSYDREKRTALEGWCELIEKIVAQKKVVPKVVQLRANLGSTVT